MQNKITREDFIEFKKHNSINKLYKPENIDYYNFMLNWSPLLSSDYYTDMTRINWIYNDRHSFLSCCICNNILSGNATDYWGIGYTKTCSHDCRYKSMHLETKKTCIKRYGVTNNLHIPYVEKQIQENNIKKYGNKHPYTYGSKEFKQLMRDKYNDEYYSNIEKKEQTNLKKYGNKYGITFGSYIFKQRLKEKYGVEYVCQKYEFQIKSKQKYLYRNIFFDSKPEIAYYIWLLDNNINFQYKPNIKIQYEFNNKLYTYYPDFKVNETLVEIKGDQFFDIDGKMICPFKNKNWTQEQYIEKCKKYEAKHQCMIQNNVIILRSADYNQYLKYVFNKYGKDFLNNCKYKNLN